MAEETWGRWGESDELGALNWIDSNTILRAVGIVRQGRVLSLAQPLSVRTPMPEARPRMSHFFGRDGGDYAAGQSTPGGFQFADDTIVLPMHSGTHIDALCHAWCGGLLYNGVPQSEVRSSGAKRLGVDKLLPIVSRGVLLDFVELGGGPMADGETITPDRLEAAIARSGSKLEKGDVVVLRTGWLESRSHANPVRFDCEPGLGVEAALRLAETGVAVVGADNYAVETLPFPPGEFFPVHQRLIRDYGVPLLEGLRLAPLAEAGARVFLFVGAPLPIVGATGSPLTPVAVF